MDKYVVFGNPISHSKSPLIHGLLAEQTKQDIEYTYIEADLDKFTQAVYDFRDSGGKGCNVTSPFKEEAFALADHKTEGALLAEAANTLTFHDDGTISAETTDGAGFLLDLKNNQAPLTGKRILLIGAGGAARGVIKPLLDTQPALLSICNRTISKAEQLVARFSEYGSLDAISAEQLATLSQPYDLIINSTSASLHNQLPPVPAQIFKGCTFVYDMAYANEPTIFINWAKEQGATTVIDGLGMLVGQAAESFEIWRKVKTDIPPILAAVRKTL
ncbi:shikimate dehydrogenase [Thalassotalea agariperforans]